MAWHDVLPAISDGGTAMLLGKKRHGKTALAYHIGETRFQLDQIPMAVWGPGPQVRSLLPDWIEIADSLEHLVTFKRRTLLIDEGSLAAYSRNWQSASAMELDQAISLSGQREQFLIVCTHHTRKIDPMLVREVDILAYKMPTTMHTKMERGEVRAWTLEARERLVAIPEADRKRWSWVYWDDFDRQGLLENPLPSFWSDAVSKATSAALDDDGELPPGTLPMDVSPQERQLLGILRSGQINVSRSLERR